jgi:mono/diheme cytochrome c family protein
MRGLLYAIAIGAVLLSGAGSGVSASPPAKGAAQGRQLFLSRGCSQCHGTRGEGGNAAGPRLAPMPIPLETFRVLVRKPQGRMPAYTELVMSDTEIADIHAYLRTVPKGKTFSEIPMLKSP